MDCTKPALLKLMRLNASCHCFLLGWISVPVFKKWSMSLPLNFFMEIILFPDRKYSGNCCNTWSLAKRLFDKQCKYCGSMQMCLGRFRYSSSLGTRVPGPACSNIELHAMTWVFGNYVVATIINERVKTQENGVKKHYFSDHQDEFQDSIAQL